MKKGIMILVIALVGIIVSCTDANNQPEQKAVETGTVIEDNEHYTVKDNGDYSYSYRITDEEGSVLLEDNACMKQPHIIEVNESIIGVSVQYGTGRSTNWARYCNIQTGAISEEFQYVLGEVGDYVIYANREADSCYVVAQNIFDRAAYYKEYELEAVAPVAADFITDFRTDDSRAVIVTYLAGETYEEKELTLQLG